MRQSAKNYLKLSRHLGKLITEKKESLKLETIKYKLRF